MFFHGKIIYCNKDKITINVRKQKLAPGAPAFNCWIWIIFSIILVFRMNGTMIVYLSLLSC
jgi:hypothetical protein